METDGWLVRGAQVMDRLPAEAFFAIVGAVGVSVLLGCFELIFRWLDGPFPNLPAGVQPLKIYRRPLYRWMWIAAAVVMVMAGAARVVPGSWRENLALATLLAGVLSSMALWFLYYIARRYDYGSAAVQSNFWFHWTYTAAQMDAWEAGAGAETWIGPDGLMFAGDYAPWSLYTYELVRAEARTDYPARLVFTFKKTSFGDATSTDVMQVPVPEGRSADVEVIDRHLRALRPRAEIHLR